MSYVRQSVALSKIDINYIVIKWNMFLCNETLGKINILEYSIMCRSYCKEEPQLFSLLNYKYFYKIKLRINVLISCGEQLDTTVHTLSSGSRGRQSTYSPYVINERETNCIGEPLGDIAALHHSHFFKREVPCTSL